jgi:hypothetical protein|tara:strand:+ start:713 stop:907 length:195 start_codon:yes stop_codon:yes gene_type:complete
VTYLFLQQCGTADLGEARSRLARVVRAHLKRDADHVVAAMLGELARVLGAVVVADTNERTNLLG